MKNLVVTVLTAGLLASASAAIQLTERQLPSVVGLDITRRAIQNPAERDALRRRQSKTVTETLTNEATLYYANVSIGTPAQDLSLHIDTGSSDLWANVASSPICTYRGKPCSSAGTYGANSSSTYKFVNSDFNVSYVDGSAAAGDYATDTVSIGGQLIADLQFGIGYDSTIPQGILGIGYTANEAQVNTAGLKSYANLPQAMANAGLIQSNAYSLWLNDLDAGTGSILFGGVDTAKYTGQLQTIPIQKIFNQYAQFIITLTGVDLVNNGNKQSMTTDLPTAVILDSGSSLAYLPNHLTSAIFSALKVQYDQSLGAGVCDCSLANQNMTLDFTFTSPTISIPMNELVINPNAGSVTNNPSGTGNRGSQNIQNSGQNAGNAGSQCIFGIAPAEGSAAVLGDTFLRSAYVVYDLANNEISLAQTNFNATDSKVLEIGTGTASVPDATLVSSAVQAAVSASGGARIGAITGTSGSPFATGTSTSSAISKRVSYGGLVLAAGITAALVCA